MKKVMLKKLLMVLDTIELQGITLKDAPLQAYEEMIQKDTTIKLNDIKAMILFLHQKKALIEGNNGIDLTPAATIYAKSALNSALEALAIFEVFLQDPNIRNFFQNLIKENTFVSKQDALSYIDEDSLQIMLQTLLFDVDKELLRFHPKLMRDISAIAKEYDEDFPLVSTTLLAMFTSSIVSHENLTIEYKNEDFDMIDYPNMNTILDIIPRRGIPHDRDETKALQAFYKDSLFHEFDHCCPVCGINIPYMLIASHIKPFRDCAHIYEAMDHNNGLLLCKNHDYLFDQGYFSFDDDGCIMISKELLSLGHIQDAYGISPSFHLPNHLMTKTRKLFLAYHRKHIYKDKDCDKL